MHPSRHGTYDGISFHPYETVFVKSSWHVADPYTSHYSKWRLMGAAGLAGTQGAFDEKLYRYCATLRAACHSGVSGGTSESLTFFRVVDVQLLVPFCCVLSPVVVAEGATGRVDVRQVRHAQLATRHARMCGVRVTLFYR